MNDNPMISASLLCANVFELPFFLKIMEKNNVEYLHMDVFDGHFVRIWVFRQISFKISEKSPLYLLTFTCVSVTQKICSIFLI